MAQQVDAIVIGAGEAGIARAGRMAAAGKRVVLVEAGPPGETYLQQTGIAIRALAESASAIRMARHAGALGLSIAGPINVEMRAVRARQARLVQAETAALAGRLGAFKTLRRLEGEARFLAPGIVGVGKGQVSAPEMVLDIGASPVLPNWPGLESVSHLLPALMPGLDSLPGHLIVAGASAAGLEFAQIQARFGAKVTVVEAGPRPLPGEDEAAAELLRAALEADGVSFLFNTVVEAADRAGHGSLLSLRSGQKLSSIEGTHLLLAPEPKPATGSLELAAAGIDLDEAGCIKVDAQGHTSAAGVLAPGPGTTGSVFARRTIWTDPPFIRLGFTQAQLRRAGHPVRVASRKDGAAGELAKLLLDAGSGALLGASLVGADAPVLAAALRPALLSGAAPDLEMALIEPAQGADLNKCGI